MSYYQTCPECGDHLDPGESCDCEKEKGVYNMDEQYKQFAEMLNKMGEQEKEQIYIAAIGSDDEYKAMIQSVTNERLKGRLIAIREIAKSALESNKKAANAPTDQSEALTAHNTTGSGCQTQHTTKTGKAQGVSG